MAEEVEKDCSRVEGVANRGGGMSGGLLAGSKGGLGSVARGREGIGDWGTGFPGIKKPSLLNIERSVGFRKRRRKYTRHALSPVAVMRLILRCCSVALNYTQPSLKCGCGKRRRRKQELQCNMLSIRGPAWRRGRRNWRGLSVRQIREGGARMSMATGTTELT
jgi:hypothetical protein